MKDEAGSEKMIVDDAVRYIMHGTLPRNGGFEDQDPRFCAALPIVEDVLTTARAANG
jgi:hypothetical protein